ncbi:MAG: hypothetical protein PUH78_00230, partial [Clostridia bacterium]|nr:hypothetical protein [Clostridia bacterium]
PAIYAQGHSRRDQKDVDPFFVHGYLSPYTPDRCFLVASLSKKPGKINRMRRKTGTPADLWGAFAPAAAPRGGRFPRFCADKRILPAADRCVPDKNPL